MAKDLKKAPKTVKPTKTPKTPQTINENEYKVTIFSKILALPVLVALVLLWWLDRAMHLILPHATHPKLTEYITTKGSVKHTVARVIIFSAPVFVYKAIRFIWDYFTI